ncbi:hypothetical protein COOONC_14018, partial [Cooperia oncophora]
QIHSYYRSSYKSICFQKGNYVIKANKQRASGQQLKESRSKESSRGEKAVSSDAPAHEEMSLRSSDIGLVSFSGLSEPCSVGSIVEVVKSKKVQKNDS